MARLDYFNDSNAPKPNSIVPSASAIVTNDEGKILLHRRSDNDLWAVPGGAMDIGESIGETVVREVKEETGLDVKPEYIIGVILIPNTSSHFLTVRCVNSSLSVSIVQLLAEKYGQVNSLTRLLSFPPRKSNI